MLLQELSYEIDRHHDAYMEFMEQCLDKQDLLAQVGQGLRIEEKHLIYLELMIMEQVADWEVGTGNNVEKILKGSRDLIPSLLPLVEIQIMGGKVCLKCKGKTLLGVVNKLLKTKSLLTSPTNVLPFHLM